ncbi:MAG: cytochrome P450 [Leptolyngbyaceae cyanobacterium bins.349]|nr:cytochrome P450 [Leptolyngbyaceae cyanobacterium bins.349]
MDTQKTMTNPLSKNPLWQRVQWVADPVSYMEQAAQEHPDLFTAQITGFNQSLVFVNTPEGMQELLTNDRKTYAALGVWNRFLSPLLGDYSVIMLERDRHRKRRQLLMPPFHGDRMKAYGELIMTLAQQVFDQLPLNQPFSARDVMQSISLQVIMQSVFGVYEGDRYEQLKSQLTKLADSFRSPLASSMLFFTVLQQDWGAWSPWGKFVRERQQMDDLIYAEIRDRRANPDPNRIDILSLLLSATDEAGQPMTDQELRDELVTLMFAGHETTATAMSWALYWMYQRPEVQEKLLHELDNADLSDSTGLFRLPYLTAICNETLRIHPVAMLTFPRVVQEPTKLIGHSLAPDTIVVGCMYLLHQREDLYPNPKEFRPERFLERQYSPYEFIPFGSGARRCIGEALAQFEMKLVLATVLRRYKLALADTQPEIPRRRGVTLAPARGVKMVKTGTLES